LRHTPEVALQQNSRNNSLEKSEANRSASPRPPGSAAARGSTRRNTCARGVGGGTREGRRCNREEGGITMHASPPESSLLCNRALE
jgi:hypothetical protein